MKQCLKLHVTLHYLPSLHFICKAPYENANEISLMDIQACSSRGRSVGIATGHGLDDRGFGVRVPEGTCISISSGPALRLIQPPVQCVPGGGLTPGVKRKRREAYHSRPTSAEVKRTRIYTSTSPHAHIA
jgi:hypothetical protein